MTLGPKATFRDCLINFGFVVGIKRILNPLGYSGMYFINGKNGSNCYKISQKLVLEFAFA